MNIGTLLDLAQVVIGFSLIIFIHEMGHFLAARWAGIRVLAFALGFGPALFSYRKGLGLRRGSSEREYHELLTTQAAAKRDRRSSSPTPPSPADISPTEYRLNALPLGGYVKMLGQDDSDPAAQSDASDSYQRCAPVKRMVVISAGVIMDALTAAVLFVIVFRVGLEADAPRVGDVLPGSPAAKAVAVNARAMGVTEPGLKTGDLITTIDGENIESFKDINIASMMSAKGSALNVTVQRAGVREPLQFRVTPEEDPGSRLLVMGFYPAVSARLTKVDDDQGRAAFAAITRGAPIEPEWVLTSIAGKSAASPYDLWAAAKSSDGRPIDAVFAPPPGQSGEPRTVALQPRAELLQQRFTTALLGEQRTIDLTHLLGLAPVITVAQPIKGSIADKAGLKPGDIFVRLGDAEYPSPAEGVVEIQRHKGRVIPIVVVRSGDGHGISRVTINDVKVSSKGTLGFIQGSSDSSDTLIARWPSLGAYKPIDPTAVNTESPVTVPPPSGVALALPAGSRIISVGSLRVANFADIRTALLAAAANARDDGPISVRVTYRPALAASSDGEAPEVAADWTIPRDEIAAVRKLSWYSPLPASLFELEKVTLHRDSIAGAVSKGLSETRNAMVQTYMTLARLFQGSVKVEHLKGPVGIAHIGTLVADRGFIWLLFFMAMVSVNLAVINFLPMPIADGGQFLYLVYETLTGRPVSARFQTAAFIVGLVMLGSLFLVVTYNDLASLLWPK